jgi:hypothetical protein
MNKVTRLLAMLDAVFGFENKVKSNFKKIKQDFDDQTNEHVIVIEYRVQAKRTMQTTPSKQQVNQGTMLQQLYAQGQANQNQKKK